MTTAEKLQQVAENMNKVSNTGYRHGYQEGYDTGYTEGESMGIDFGYNALIYDTQPLLDEILALQQSYIGGEG